VTSWSDAGYGLDPEGDARRRAELELARLDPAAIRAAHERVEDEVLASLTLPDLVVTIDLVVPEELDAHAVTTTPYAGFVAWTCACGRWEAVATGPSSARWAGQDHARHKRDEEAGARGE
jgi:hypothetical protein